MRKVTVVFDDDELYKAIKVEAAKRMRPIKELIAEALELWLEIQEEREDLADYRARMAEYRKEGGVPWGYVKARMRAIVSQRQGSGVQD